MVQQRFPIQVHSIYFVIVQVFSIKTNKHYNKFLTENKEFGTNIISRLSSQNESNNIVIYQWVAHIVKDGITDPFIIIQV